MNTNPWNPLPVWQSACLVFLAFSVYAFTLQAGFVYDDISITVLKNPFLHGEVTAWDVLLWDRPLREFTYKLDHLIWGFNPLGYHLQSMIWHTANCWLVMVLLVTLGINKNTAFWSAVLFAVHPINTEAVAWISGRKDLLCLFFELLACIWFMQAYQQKVMRWFYAGSMLAFVLALLSKQVAIVLPGFLCLCVGYYHIKQHISFQWSTIIKWISPFVIFTGISLIFYFDIFTVLGIIEDRGTFYDPSAAEVQYTSFSAVLTPFATFFQSMRLLTFPDVLMIDREFYPVISVLDWRWFVGCFCFLLLLFVCLYHVKTCPALLYGYLWFVFAWFPLSGIAPVGYLMADRYLYIPNVGFCLFAVALFEMGCKKFEWQPSIPSPKIFLIWINIVIVLFAVRTVTRTFDWQNELTLWQSALKHYPQKASIYFNLGNYYWDQDSLDEANGYWQQALELDPAYEEVWLNMGIAAKNNGDLERALECYQQALEINPQYGNAHYNLALLLEDQNNAGDAIQHFQQAAKTLFGKRNAAQLQAMACYHAARLLHQQGSAQQAMAYIKRGLTLSQHHAPSFVLYGMLLDRNPQTAKQAFLTAISISPTYAAAHFNLGVLEWTQGNRTEANNHWKTAVSLDPTLQDQINRIQNR